MLQHELTIQYLYYSIHAKKQNHEAVWNSFNRAAFNRQSRLPTRPWKCINLRPGAHSGLPTERYPGKLSNIIARCKNQSQERFRDQRIQAIMNKKSDYRRGGGYRGSNFFFCFIQVILLFVQIEIDHLQADYCCIALNPILDYKNQFRNFLEKNYSPILKFWYPSNIDLASKR